MKKIVKSMANKLVLSMLAMASLFSIALPAFATDPTVSTNAATDVSSSSAKLNGTAPSAGSSPITSRGFEYGLDDNYGSNSAEDLVSSYAGSLLAGRNSVTNGQFNEPLGTAVDSSSNVYVVDSSNHRIQKFDSNGNFITAWGTQGSGDGQLSYPNAITIDSSDNIYVVDAYNYRIQKFNTSGSFVAKWGSVGGGAGQFYGATGISSDTSGSIYVADRHRIQKFDSTGNLITSWGTQGSGDGQFSHPGGVGVDAAGNVYVLDNENFRIQKFDSSGNFITKWGSYGTGDGEISYPQSISVTSSGDVYFSQYAVNRIQKFDSNGNFITSLGTNGSGDGQFANPHGMAIDTDGTLYVVDTRNYRIQKFNNTDTYLSQWGYDSRADGSFYFPSGITVHSSGDIYVADTQNNRIQKFDSNGNFAMKFGSYGSGNGELYHPTSVAVDLAGNIFVVDTNNSRIQKFNSSGVYQSQFGGYGAGNGQLSYPQDILISSAGDIYISDYGNHRIQKFNSSGVYQSQFGSLGSGDGEFQNLKGISFDSSENIYAVDSFNHRIQKFNSSGVYQSQFGSYGSGNGQLSYPYGITVDSSGYVYVADSSNHRIQKFNSSGVYQSQFGSYGSGNDQLISPQGVDLDAVGEIYVADSTNGRIQKFTENTNEGDFNTDVSNLTCSTTYHYRAYATNTAGTSYGDDATFTTAACPVAPTVTTGSTSYVSSDSANLSIDITSNGGSDITSYGIDYGTTTEYGETSGNNNNATGEQQIYLYNLTCGTTYHYRAYANNSAGSSHGEDRTFITDPCPQPYDMRLRASLLNTEPVQAGDTVQYQLKAKNLGPGSAPGVYFYVNIPQETSYNSASFNMPEGFEGECEDQGSIAEAEGPFSGYAGNLVVCVAFNENGFLNPNTEITLNLSLNATSNFSIGTSILRGLAFNEDENEVDILTFFNATENGTPLYDVDINNIVNLIYGQNDADGDGIYDNVEDSAPNSGDANSDGTQDSQQPYVASLLNTVNDKYAVLEVDEACEIADATIRDESANTAQDQGNDYPNGLMDFTLNCGTPGYTANISQYYYGTSKDGFSLRKYNPSTKTYSTVDNASISETTIDNQIVTTATYQVKDGGALDLDGVEDGNIHDPAGLARKSALAATGERVGSFVTLGVGMILVAGGLVILNRKRSSK